jgi:hypothetical protein
MVAIVKGVLRLSGWALFLSHHFIIAEKEKG